MTKNKNKRTFNYLCSSGSFRKSISRSGSNHRFVFVFGSRSGSDSKNRSVSGSAFDTNFYYPESFSGSKSCSWSI